MNEQDILELFKKSGALLEGHFELRSGLHSPVYFQCALVLCWPDIAERLCSELGRKLMNILPGETRIDTVISPALGGIIVGHELGRFLHARVVFTEKEIDETGKNVVMALRRFNLTPGERVVVAEDVVTRGGRVEETIAIVERAGAVVTAVAVLVDRSGGKVKFKYPSVSLLQIEPVVYEPTACPLCASGIPLVHPGSLR
jgi:orotate phosphoribosyltransferase